MAINPANDVLDIINGTLRVTNLDVKQGSSMSINTLARNDVILSDDQKSTTTFMPTVAGGYMSSTGVTRDTTAGYLELGTTTDAGWVYWPLQLPNSWHTEFDMHVTATGGILTFSLFNTSGPNHTNHTNNDGGYKIVFDNTNNQIVIYWEGSVHKTVSASLRSNDWQYVNINYFQGAVSISLAGKVVLTHEFTENYQEMESRYIGFSATAGTSHKIRQLRIHHGNKWIYTKTSNASDITYVSGNVGIGSLSPTELLDVHGNVHIAKDLTVDGNLTVTGTTTYIDTTNATIEDPIIELAKGNTNDTIDAGLIVTRGASNVAIAFRGDEEELAFGYTQSGASGTDVTPIANGGLDVRVYGNLFANNLTTTANVEATYLKGDGSEITQVTLDQVVGYANTTANTIQLTNSDVGLKATGNVEANYFVGDGSKLTGLVTDLQSVADNGNTCSNTIQFTNATTAFIANSNVGIGTATPSANLHVVGYQYVNDPPTLASSFDHTDAPLTLTHGTATSDTAINDPKPLLHLTRDGTTSQSYGARASFNLSRYENSSTHSRSRLDVALADGTYAESPVMTLRSDGKVGVGTVTPTYTLDVHGSANVGALTATTISGSVSGNASTATALQTPRAIGGVYFDGTADIILPGVNAPGTQNTAGNAATATALQTARAIGGVYFDGTADINLPGVNAQGTQDTIGNAATATTAVNQSGGTVNATTGHFSGDVTLESNLYVNGDLTYANTVNMIVSDPIIELGANNQHTNDLGLVLTRHGNSGTDSNVAIFYDESGDNLKIGYTDDGATQTTLSTTATGLDVSITGNVAAAYDTDTVSYFGRAAVGYMGQSDQASFSHLDKNTSTNFALKQAASGATHLNTPTGQHIRFSVNASEVGRFTGGGDFKVGANKLYVDTSASEVQMYSQATGSTAGPNLLLMRNNGSSAGSNGDYIGQVRYEGLSSSGTSRLYAKTTGKIKTATNGSESGIIETALITGGSQRISVRHSGDLFHIKNGTDFKVGETANLYVDTSTSRVGIGTASPVGRLDVWDGVHTTASADANMYIRHAANSATGYGAALIFENTDGANATRKKLGKIGSFRENNAANYNAYLGFYTSDGSLFYERMRISQAGNVGISKTDPSYKLDVLTDTNWDGIMLRSTSNLHGYLLKDSNGCSLGMNESGIRKVYIRTNAASYLNGGNVGIGTDNPGELLTLYSTSHLKAHIESSGAGTAAMLLKNTNGQWTIGNNATTADLELSSSAGTKVYFKQAGNVGIGTASPGGKLTVQGDLRIVKAEESWGGVGHLFIQENTTGYGQLRIGANQSYIFLDTYLSNTPMVINSTGGANLGINERTPTEKLHVGGNILASGNITAYSDKRLKSDITKIENALDKIEKLNGYTFTVKDERYTGLIAQEVLPVLPEAVSGSEETQYGLAYGNMMGLVVEAIKELREEIKSIKSRL